MTRFSLRPACIALILVVFLAAPLTAQEQEAQERDPEEAREAADNEFLDALDARDAAQMTPSEVGEAATDSVIQGGGAEIHVVAQGTPPTVVRGPGQGEPDDPRDRRQPDDPRDTRPPTIYGEELCPADKVEGQFEPAQGVWQDDPTFVDKPGKQIVKQSPVLWHAELPMVTNRKSLLFGIEYADGAEPRRNEIFIKGEASGTLVPVFFRFTLTQAGSTELVYESEIVGQVPIGGPCGPAPTPFEVVLDVSNGVPREFTFEFKKDGDYTIKAELVTADGRPTGIKVRVIGRSMTTYPPEIAFVPVAILPESVRDESSRLEAAAEELRIASALRIPDFFPVVNVPLKTGIFPLKNQSKLLVRYDESGRRQLVSEVVDELGFQLESLAAEDLARELQVGGIMTGFDRIVALITDRDHGTLKRWIGARIDAVAWAQNQKVVFINVQTGSHLFTVGHEIAHTLRFLFSTPEMEAECAVDYHNTGDPMGHGHQITEDGLPSRARRDFSPHLMGPAWKKMSFKMIEGIMILEQTPETDIWIEQCTYRHLLEILSAGAPDPRVVLVQGFIGRREGRTAGVFMPFYDLDGVVDLPAGGTGSWAIVLRDESGNVLARHAWEPEWRIPELDVERGVVAFAFRVPWVEGLARVDLEGPGGLLDNRTLSASAPAVTLTSPAEGEPAPVEEGSVRVAWSGSDADGDPLFYTVLYSSDGGQRWMDVAFETAETSVLVPLDPEAARDAHRVLVRATDGARSSDAIRAFQPAVQGE